MASRGAVVAVVVAVAVVAAAVVTSKWEGYSGLYQFPIRS